MQATALTIRPTTEADWERVRDLRLEMLADTPLAFGETLETARGHAEPEWRMRAARGTATGSACLVAVDGDDRWLGQMGAFLPAPGSPLLVGVYVSPAARGTGTADLLLEGVEAWARERGSSLRLSVHEQNTRARAFYAKKGFFETGSTHPYVLDPAQREFDMRKQL